MISILFGGNTYLLVGTMEAGAAIATVEAYQSAQSSFAYLEPNGRIMRHGKQIGTRDDIQVLGEVEVKTNVPEDQIYLHFLAAMKRK